MQINILEDAPIQVQVEVKEEPGNLSIIWGKCAPDLRSLLADSGSGQSGGESWL